MQFKQIGDYFFYSEDESINPHAIISAIKNKSGIPMSHGRTSAYEITAGSRNIVIREFMRGGFFGKIFKNIFTSEKRFTDEFIILKFLIQNDFPTAIPACVVYIKKKFYNGFIGTHKISAAKNFYEILKDKSITIEKSHYEIFSEIIDKIYSLHKSGIYNPDIHIKNILIENGSNKIFIIDFDKSVKKQKTSIYDFYSMCYRFLRSAAKLNKDISCFSYDEFQQIMEKVKKTGGTEVNNYLRVAAKFFHYRKF